MSPLIKKYVHRQNEDETFNSICVICTRTVARGMSEIKLAEAEKLHKCPGLPPSVVNRK